MLSLLMPLHLSILLFFSSFPEAYTVGFLFLLFFFFLQLLRVYARHIDNNFSRTFTKCTTIHTYKTTFRHIINRYIHIRRHSDTSLIDTFLRWRHSDTFRHNISKICFFKLLQNIFYLTTYIILFTWRRLSKRIHLYAKTTFIIQHSF